MLEKVFSSSLNVLRRMQVGITQRTNVHGVTTQLHLLLYCVLPFICLSQKNSFYYSKSKVIVFHCFISMLLLSNPLKRDANLHGIPPHEISVELC